MDILYNSMKKDIINFYDSYYVGDSEGIKQMHLYVLKELYDIKRFRFTKNLSKEREDFLFEVYYAMESMIACN